MYTPQNNCTVPHESWHAFISTRSWITLTVVGHTHKFFTWNLLTDKGLQKSCRTCENVMQDIIEVIAGEDPRYNTCRTPHTHTWLITCDSTRDQTTVDRPTRDVIASWSIQFATFQQPARYMRDPIRTLAPFSLTTKALSMSGEGLISHGNSRQLNFGHTRHPT